MESGVPEQPHADFEIQVPPEEEGGRFANFLGVWHSQHEFTLDFAALQPPQAASEETSAQVVVPAKVVARIRIPPTLMFNILQTLNANLTRYEDAFGEIRQGQEGEQ